MGWNWQSSRSARSRARRVRQHGAGADRAPRVRRAPPQRGAAAGGQHRRRGGDRAGVRDRRRRSCAPSLHRRRHRGSLEHLETAAVAAAIRAEPRGDRPPGLAAAGVDDPARRVPALQAERQRAARPRRRSRTPRACSSCDRGRRLGGQHLHRRSAAQPAAGVQGVVARGVRASRPAPAPRRGRPAPSSWSSRRAACGRSGPSRAPASAARIATNRPAAPPPTTATSNSVLPSARPSAALRYPREWPSTSPTPRRTTTTPALTPRTPGRLARDRGRDGGARLAWRRARRRRRRPSASGSSGSTRPATSTRSRASAPEVAAMIDHDTRGQRRLLGGGPSRRGRRRQRRRAAARGRRRGPRSAPLRPPGHHAERDPGDGLLPVQQRRDRGRARPRRLRRRAGAGPRLGRAPRQRDGGDLRRLGRGALRSIHQSPLYPGTGPADFTGVGAGRGVHASTCRCRPARAPTSSWRWSSTLWCPWRREFRARA